MSALKRLLPALAFCAIGLPGCTAMTAGPAPGTPEFAADRVSRGYDCGVSVDRGRIIARLSREERQRFAAAGATFAVKSYKAPRPCPSDERAAVQHDLSVLARR